MERQVAFIRIGLWEKTVGGSGLFCGKKKLWLMKTIAHPQSQIFNRCSFNRQSVRGVKKKGLTIKRTTIKDLRFF